jgi:uncharacterized protein
MGPPRGRPVGSVGAGTGAQGGDASAGWTLVADIARRRQVRELVAHPGRTTSLECVPALTDKLDLGSLHLSTGEGRRLQLAVEIEPLKLGGECYVVQPARPTAMVDVSRMVGHGYALRLRLKAAFAGPCMRCLARAAPEVEVDAREVDRPGGGEELRSPYVEDETLDLAAWARDAFALSAPAQVLCRPDCAGLCPVCAADLNEAEPGHGHEREPDPRWAKLRELRLE